MTVAGLLLFPNAQDVALKYLRTALPERDEPEAQDVDVSTKVPTSREGTAAEPLVVVRRVGGLTDGRVSDVPRLDFMVWHSSEFKAERLAQIVRSLVLFDLPGRVVDGHTVYGVTEFSGPAQFPDPAGSSAPIYLFTAEPQIRGASA